MTVYMSCGCLLGDHRFGCEDAIPSGDEPITWPAERDGRIVWLTPAEEAEGLEIRHASESEARAWLETAT